LFTLILISLSDKTHRTIIEGMHFQVCTHMLSEGIKSYTYIPDKSCVHTFPKDEIDIIETGYTVIGIHYLVIPPSADIPHNSNG
jgi:hypothetical protein